MKLYKLCEKSIIRTALLGIVVIAFFVSIVFAYYNMVYEEKRSNIIKDGRMAAIQSADQFERYLSANIDLVKFTAYTLDEMIIDKKTDEEIQDFLVGQSTAIRNAVIENSTGLYGYINGRFFSGTNWEPPKDYDATNRPWYIKPMKSPGQLTILEPYIDVQSGNTMLALGKTLCDGKSVISVDVSLDRMQKLTEEAVKEGGSDIEMILTDDGDVVTHSDVNEIGKNYGDETGTLGAEIFGRLSLAEENYFEFDHNREHYIVYDAKFQGDWHCISVHNATRVFGSLTGIFVITILVVTAIVLILGIMLVISGRRAVTARQAMAENEAKADFLSKMSHEIRTPINAVLGMNEMILRESREINILGYSEKIRIAGQELLKLVNELFDFSKQEPINSHEFTGRSFTAPAASILAVDDNPMNLEVLKNLLKRTQVNIDTAISGDEGLEFLQKKKYDLILLDHMMPQKDGIETLHELRDRKDGLNAATPAICLTANVIAGARDKYIKEGFADHMTKPLDSGRLEALLIKYLPEDKIEYGMADAETPAAFETVEIVIPDQLKLLESFGIDLREGINRSGSAEAYTSLLKIFCNSIDEKKTELEGYLSKGDIKNYVIKIHALKSSARIIGAESLGDIAQALEDAGKSGDTEYIRVNHDIFMADYLSLREPLSMIFSKEEDKKDKPLAEPELMKEVFSEIKEAADEMDCDRLQMIFKEMEDYRIPDNDTGLWKKLSDASENYEYDKILELIGNNDNS